MNELERIFQMMMDENGEGGTDNPDTPESGKDSTEGKEKTAQENQPYKAFSSEEEFNKFVKSQQSKAKNDILKALEAKSVDEGKQKLNESQQLKQELDATANRIAQLEEENAIVKTGVSEDYKDDALTLARAKVDDNTDLSSALAEVIKKHPHMAGKQNKPKDVKVGSDKGNEPEQGKDDVKERIKQKYP